MGSRISFAAAMAVLSRQVGTMASYSNSFQDLRSFGLALRWETVRIGDPAPAGSLDLARETHVAPAGGTPAHRDVAMPGPVVDDVRAHSKPLRHRGNGELVRARWGGIDVAVDVRRRG